MNDGYSGDHEEIFLPLKCQTEWFQDGLSEWCPYANAYDVVEDAVYQAYEGGETVSYRNLSRVIFDEPANSCRDYVSGEQLNPGVDVPDPPDGQFEPEPSFAHLWLGSLPGTEGLRERLGWPIAPPESFVMVQQCERTRDGLGRCFVSMPDGRILSPELIALAPLPEQINFADGACYWVDLASLRTPPYTQNTCQGPTYMVWATHELNELTDYARAALTGYKITEFYGEESRITLSAFGEDWFEVDDDAGSDRLCYFSIMESTLILEAPVDDVSDTGYLGTLLAQILSALEQFPPDYIQHFTLDRVDLTYRDEEEDLSVEFLLEDGFRALAEGVVGSALLDELNP